MGATGFLISATLGWIWERILEGKLGELPNLVKQIIVAILCLLTAGAQVYFEGIYEYATMDLGQWFGYAATIFLTSQAVYEKRKDGLNKIEGYTIEAHPSVGDDIKKFD